MAPEPHAPLFGELPPGHRSGFVAPTAQMSVRALIAAAENSGAALAVTVTTTSAPSTASAASRHDVAGSPSRRASRESVWCDTTTSPIGSAPATRLPGTR